MLLKSWKSIKAIQNEPTKREFKRDRKRKIKRERERVYIRNALFIFVTENTSKF